MSDLAKIIADMRRQIVEGQRRQANMMRSGKVIAVDPAIQSVKIDIGDEGNALPTPWIRWGERAGARKTWNPPTVGEFMTVMSPSGEIGKRSFAVHGGFTDANAAPSADGDAAVFSLGEVTVTIKGDSATIVVGGSTVDVTPSGFTLTTPQIALSADSLSMDVGGGGIGISVSGSEIALTGGKITHNGKDIGDSHTHSGIRSGGSNTGTPN